MKCEVIGAKTILYDFQNGLLQFHTNHNICFSSKQKFAQKIQLDKSGTAARCGRITL